jgi:phenylalanine ammonia-lyase
MLMEPSFSGGLSGSLVGNPHRSVNMGLKGLQIAGNSIMPLIGFYGNSLADRFPTHAEQFNQNINSQGFGSALLTRRSVELAEQLLAIALIVGVQAVELRTRMMGGSFDAREFLSATTAPAYEAVHTLLGKEIDPGRPLVFNDDEQLLDRWLAAIVADIRGKSRLLQAIA